MLNNKSLRTTIILINIGLILLLGMTYVFGPMVVLSTFHFNKENLVISPIEENYHYMFYAFGVLILSLSILAWRKTIWTIIGSVAGVLLFGYFMYASAQGYFAIHNDYVVLKTAKTEQKIEWSDMTKIEYYNDFNGIPETLYFYNNDTNIKMNTTGQFTYQIITKVRNKASKHQFPYEEITDQQ